MARKARKKAATRAKPADRRSATRTDTIPRALLAREVQRRIDKFGLSRELAATIVGDAASQMSRLMTGHIGEFSADRLVKMLTRLGSDVTITVKHAPGLGHRGRVRVKAN